MVRQLRNPGWRLTPNQRASKLLAEMPNLNDGHYMGGIAHMVNMLLRGYLQGRDSADYEEALAALNAGKDVPTQDQTEIAYTEFGTDRGKLPPSIGPTQDPFGGGPTQRIDEPTITIPGDPYTASAERLGALGQNPYANRMLQDLRERQREWTTNARLRADARRMQLQDRRDDREYAAQRDAQAWSRQQRGVADQRAWQQQQALMQQKFQADQNAKNRAIQMQQLANSRKTPEMKAYENYQSLHKAGQLGPVPFMNFTQWRAANQKRQMDAYRQKAQIDAQARLSAQQATKGKWAEVPNMPHLQRNTVTGEVKAVPLSPEQKAKGAALRGGITPVTVTTTDGKQKTFYPTAGSKKLDQKFAEIYADFFLKGGLPDVQKNLSQLQRALEILKDPSANATGLQNLFGRTLRTVFGTKNIVAQDVVEEVVQRNLRLILGSQFTKEEGERLIARAYNPALPEAENIRRVTLLFEQIRSAAIAVGKAGEYWQNNGGTLLGFNPSLPYSGQIQLPELPKGLGEARQPASTTGTKSGGIPAWQKALEKYGKKS